MPLSQPTISCSFHAKGLFKNVIHSSYTLSHIHITPHMLLYHSPIHYMQNITKQGSKHPTSTYPHPSSSLRREGISLRRAPLRLGESSIIMTGTHASARLGELISLERGNLSLKTQTIRLGDGSRKREWASLCQPRLGESDSPGRDYQLPPLISPVASTFLHPNTHIRYPTRSQQRTIHTTVNILKHRPSMT